MIRTEHAVHSWPVINNKVATVQPEQFNLLSQVCDKKQSREPTII